ncbi:MAG: glycosyltransferase family 2 protein [Candidatus Tritonobacter lacicola]|nr:glycosyltransferase family 2 protein [Candidatus Tritonobacter lacicola]
MIEQEEERLKADISAFVPAYNEEENIRRVIDDLVSVLREIANRYEIIVVLYEGSTDATGRIVREYAMRNPAIRLVIQPADQKGYGVALRMGIESSRYDLIFYTDADNQYNVRDIKKLLAEIEKADIVNGHRVIRCDPKMRLLTAVVYNWIIRKLFDTGVKDVDCAFKLYRKSLLDSIRVNCRTGLADTEILAKARKLGARIIEVPVSHYPRKGGRPVFEASLAGKMGLVKPRVVIDLIKEMMKLKREFRSTLVSNG